MSKFARHVLEWQATYRPARAIVCSPALAHKAHGNPDKRAVQLHVETASPSLFWSAS